MVGAVFQFGDRMCTRHQLPHSTEFKLLKHYLVLVLFNKSICWGWGTLLFQLFHSQCKMSDGTQVNKPRTNQGIVQTRDKFKAS